mmetsp:Transcript_16084/g.27407  ORF Transcript_16084/g.27407 Transcript_16084/m.27407 type:complete len:104 (-) Transcript_16084:180-491(-)
MITLIPRNAGSDHALQHPKKTIIGSFPSTRNADPVKETMWYLLYDESQRQLLLLLRIIRILSPPPASIQLRAPYPSTRVLSSSIASLLIWVNAEFERMCEVVN